MTRRYYQPDLPQVAGANFSLDDTEASHAIRVMRVKPGDQLQLFDGGGRIATAEVTLVNRKTCQCQLLHAPSETQVKQRMVKMGIAFPKGDRCKRMIESLTELGIDTVVPITAERSQRPESESTLHKLRRTVIESCKQSGRNHLMQLSSPQGLKEFTSCADENWRWIADPRGDEPSQEAWMESDRICVLIGPEGGFTDAEISMATAHGFKALALGHSILRIETAAIVAGAKAVGAVG
ncbi:RsmE family RNA methyltransferase [Crateriforma conspicua]|uniref:Ribosomal RNA small subunit methyltransferase E n=1 Tax=Crateriforma conspicua TaxID=2527996 RepID=A0A5C5Y7G4_9PLAN|nr:RsmE family RNA methyltransferase [Crateriforma conspicua]TWT70245.1 Ribosomal RNA small subunit methyltransferase E [Crateriforma conspicua]